jgi:uncharacterized protein
MILAFVPGWRRALAFAAACAFSTGVLLAQPDPPALTDTVNDFAGVVDAASKQQIDTIVRRLQSASGDAVVVATIKTFEPWGDIRAYAAKMFENHGRGIGQKGRDNGLLVLLAIDDRRVQIEVGYELESIITDGFAGETSREVMAPHFGQSRYGEGLVAGVTTLAQRIAQARNVTLDGVPQARPRRAARRESGIPVIVWVILALVIFNAIRGATGSNVRSGRRRGRWNSHVGPFGGGYGGWSGGGWGGGGGFGGGFGGFGGGRSGGGGGGASW